MELTWARGGEFIGKTLVNQDHLSYSHLYPTITFITLVERHSSGVELRALDYENPGSNPVLRY